MQAEIDAIAAIGETVTDRKTVYFEISAAPYCYSFGEGVFLNEMIDLIGAENVLAGQEGWLSVEEESVVSANPDVILTNVNYIEDPVGEILARPGWEGVTAVQNGGVCTIDNKTSSLPNENIVQAVSYTHLFGPDCMLSPSNPAEETFYTSDTVGNAYHVSVFSADSTLTPPRSRAGRRTATPCSPWAMCCPPTRGARRRAPPARRMSPPRRK